MKVARALLTIETRISQVSIFLQHVSHARMVLRRPTCLVSIALFFPIWVNGRHNVGGNIISTFLLLPQYLPTSIHKRSFSSVSYVTQILYHSPYHLYIPSLQSI
jgi:hypothetical protein